MLSQVPDSGLKNSKQPFSSDSFDLGYLLLTCALGNLDFFDVSGFYSLENLKTLIDIASSQRQKARNCCCLLHSEGELRRIHAEVSYTKQLRESDKKAPETDNFPLKTSRTHDSNYSSNKKSFIPFTLLELLQNNQRFSQSFIDFLCLCLRIDPNFRFGPKALLDHEFAAQSHAPSGPLVHLAELMSNHMMQPDLSLNNKLNEEHLNRVCEAIKIVLYNRDASEKIMRFASEKVYENTNSREYLKLSELAVELGVPVQKVIKKFREEIFAEASSR